MLSEQETTHAMNQHPRYAAFSKAASEAHEEQDAEVIPVKEKDAGQDRSDGTQSASTPGVPEIKRDIRLLLVEDDYQQREEIPEDYVRFVVERWTPSRFAAALAQMDNRHRQFARRLERYIKPD